MALPGIGRSTAGAIVSQCFDQPAAILDGNVKRVLCRYFAQEGWPEGTEVKKRLWEKAEQLLPTKRAADYTQAMMDLGTDFFVHTGDIIYYYGFAKNIDLARWGWARMFSIDSVFDFHRRVPTYFMKDDHDTWQDDTWPTQESLFMGDLTFQDGVEIFKEQMPIDGVTYRTFRWGQDLQIWVVEGRDYRDANMDPDGPDKSIWGEEQKTWFKETVAESDATFRILISPTPLVGPDNPDKWDSHANEIWTDEGDELRQFLADNDMIVICGDRHWQYVSVDDETGLREYATGPASDVHAGGWNQGYRPEHLYLNVVGGFLSVTAERQDDRPTLTLRNHDVDGGMLFEDVLVR